MMGLRSLFPKKEIRYRADKDTVFNMTASSKEKIQNVTDCGQKHKKKSFVNYVQHSRGVFENHTHGLILLLQFCYY